MIQRDAKNQYFGVKQLIHVKTIINLDRIFLNILTISFHLIFRRFSFRHSDRICCYKQRYRKCGISL